MGKSVALGLADAGHNVIWFHDIFPHADDDMDDDKWLSKAGAEKWVVITEDLHIRTRDIELKALFDAGVRCFIVGSAQLTAQATLSRLLIAWSRIENISRSNAGPFLYRVTANGAVERRDNSEDWKRLKSLKLRPPQQPAI